MPPQIRGEVQYPKYRAAVRVDFRECCAHCLLPEALAGGESTFELDHFRPKSRAEFKELAHDFLNLYWACRACNKFKWNTWPSAEEAAAGAEFVDFCKDNFGDHYDVEETGAWKAKTPAGEYTIRIIRLNGSKRPQVRRLLAELAGTVSAVYADVAPTLAPNGSLATDFLPMAR